MYFNTSYNPRNFTLNDTEEGSHDSPQYVLQQILK